MNGGSGSTAAAGGRPPTWLLGIVAQSRFLWERLASAGVTTERPLVSNPLAEARLALWRSRLGACEGDADPVERRLALAGREFRDAYPVLGQRVAEFDPGELLPDWAPVLQRIVQTAHGLSAVTRSAPPLRPEDPIPFDDLLLPAVLVGRELLQERLMRLPSAEAERANRMLSEDARHTLERALLAHLASFCVKPLALELSKLRTFGENLLNELELPSPGGNERYERFVEQTLAAGLLPVLLEYPVLARLIATAVGFWVGSSGDLIERLGRNLPELERVFAPGRGPLGQVVALDPMLSDRHEFGRSVVVLSFENGVRCVYKPRDLGLHLGFNHFLDYCNDHSGLARIEPLRVVARDGYGFAEFAEQRPCGTRGEAEGFFTRAGMLLCLLHVLRATDCHHENLIANGEHPVLIDVETVLHPRDTAAGLDGAIALSAVATQERFSDSVLRTGMLPHWRFSADQLVAYDTSALGSTSPQRVPRKVERWVGLNTDAMHIRLKEIDFPLEKNVPRLDGEALDPTQFRGEIHAGFCAMYDFLLEHKSEMLARGGPLEALRGQRGRYIFRSSQVYASLLHGAYTPESFRDGVAFGIALESLSRAFLTGAAPAGAGKLLDAERQSLERQDIPLFCIDTGSTALFTIEGLEVPDYFARSSHDDVCEGLRSLSASDRALQAAIVAGAFDALAARTDVAASGSATGRVAARLSDDELLAEAVAIGDAFCSRAILDERGGATWLGFTYVPGAERFQHQVLNDGLYDGASGVALFLATLFAATGEARFADLAERAIADVRARISPSPASVTPQDIGGARGAGSIIYALSEISVLLSDDTISSDALRLAESITCREVAADQQFDVMGGAAGAILGLASLYRVSGSARVLEWATLCGRRLLEVQTGGAWPTLDSIALAGMSHGAAGIAYALMRLHAMNGEPAFLDAALRGIEYERGLFNAAGGSWPDLRPPLPGREQGDVPVEWCHGAAGIGLARIGCAQLMPSEEFEREIDAAVDAITHFGLGELDHLCCGNMGRIETLLAAAAHRDDGELGALARSNASQLIHRARMGGGYRLFGNLGRVVWNPGLFQGMAGIGYQLLRLRSDAVRSFALWQ